MRQNREMPIVQCRQHAFRHRLAVHAESRMDRPDDEIELVENSGVVVEATIGHDVGFDSLEDAESIETDIELVDLVELLLELVSLETTSVERRLRVVGDTDVIPAALLCRERHL